MIIDVDKRENDEDDNAPVDNDDGNEDDDVDIV